MASRIKKGDQVIVIAGKDKGKQGRLYALMVIVWLFLMLILLNGTQSPILNGVFLVA